MTVRMRYTKAGVTQEYTYPTERLWEVIERADKAFLPPLTPEDHARYQRALEINKGKK